MKYLTLSFTLLISVLFSTIATTSCGSSDEPERIEIELPNPIPSAILGEWEGGFSTTLEGMQFSNSSQLTIRDNGTIEINYSSIGPEGGASSTMIIEYEIEWNILHCGKMGDYRIALSDDYLILTLIDKETDNRIWGGISASINGVDYFYSPNEVIYKRIK